MKEIEWISINDLMPPKGINVDLKGINWRSTGWLTKSGRWSISHSKNVTILSIPTHWAEINII